MKRMVLIGLCVVLSSSLFGEMIDLSPAHTAFDVVQFDESKIAMQFSLDQFERSSQTEKGYTFDNLFVDSWTRLQEEGYPALPSIRRMVMVPANGTIDVKITELKSSLVHDIHPFPAQIPAVDNDAFETPPFVYNEDFYTSKSTYPQTPYSISDVFTIRGLHFVYFTFTPFQYDAYARTLKVIEECDIDISVNGAFQFDDRLYSPFLSSIVMENAVNPVYEAPQESMSKDVDGADLIIVTTYDFMDAAETLKEWKSQKGFYTDIAYLEEIGSTAQNIYTYLFLAYEVWSLPPSFVIFLGDSDIVPTNYIENQYAGGLLGSDRPYACMDADYHPDIAYGRISVDDEDQAFTVIDKIIQYEMNPPTLSSFYNHSVQAGYFQDDEGDGFESRRFIKTSEEIRDFLLSENYDAERIYVTGRSINPTNYNNGYYANGEPLPAELLRANGFLWNGNENDITNAINNGTFMVTHRDHGYTAGWGDPAYNIGSLSQLTNGELLPMVFSINCQTGWFDSETDDDPGTFECFTEMFLRKENGGAVSTIGACRNSLSGYNDFLAIGMIDGIWDNFLPNANFNTEGYLGNIMYEGFIIMEQYWNPLQYELDIFHILGDPTLQLWREEPQQITAIHDNSFTFNVTSIPVVANIEEGMATLVVDGELVGRTDFTSSSFDLNLSESLSEPQAGTITITARDQRPYFSSVYFIPPVGSYVIIDSFFVSDINGNNDGEWDAGEDIILTYQLTNVGNEDIDTVYLQIDTDDDFLQVVQSTNYITGLQPSESILFSNDASISMDCMNGQSIPIFTTVDNDGSEFVDLHSINVVKLPKIFIPVDSLYHEVSSTTVENIQFEIQNIGADTLHCNLVNHSHQCADITTSNSYLTIPHVSEFEHLDEFTVMMWLEVNELTQPGFILTKGTLSTDLSFTLALINSSTLLYKFKDFSGTDFQKLIPINVDTSKWFHVAIVVNETSIASYVNGEVLSVDDFTSPVYSNTSDILVGSNVNSAYEFDGYLDELALYTSALTQTEIQDQFCSTIRENTPSLLSYYKFDNETQLTDFTDYNDIIQTGTVTFENAGAPITTWFGFDCSDFIIAPYQSELFDITFNTNGYVPQLFSSYLEIISDAENSNGLNIPIKLLYDPYDVDENVTHSSFSLYYNNPFSPSDQIHFNIKTPQHVSLDIYNLRGQFVANIVDEMLAPQNYSYQWDGRDHFGKQVVNGIYFIKIQTEDNAKVRKVVFFK